VRNLESVSGTGRPGLRAAPCRGAGRQQARAPSIQSRVHWGFPRRRGRLMDFAAQAADAGPSKGVTVGGCGCGRGHGCICRSRRPSRAWGSCAGDGRALPGGAASALDRKIFGGTSTRLQERLAAFRWCWFVTPGAETCGSRAEGGRPRRRPVILPAPFGWKGGTPLCGQCQARRGVSRALPGSRARGPGQLGSRGAGQEVLA